MSPELVTLLIEIIRTGRLVEQLLKNETLTDTQKESIKQAVRDANEAWENA